MTTRRVQPSTKTYEQRKQERREADHARQREAQAEATRKRYEKSIAPPDPPRPSFEERAAIRKAEAQGAHDAAYAAEQRAAEAAASAGPVNHFRVRADELKDKLYQPDSKRKYERFDQLADEWDREQAAKAEAAEREAAIAADPMVKTSREYASGLVKLAPKEFQLEAAEIEGFAKAGTDPQECWRRMRDLESRIWAHEDMIAAEKRESKAATDAEFRDAASRAEASRERFEHAQKMASEATPAPTETPDD